MISDAANVDLFSNLPVAFRDLSFIPGCDQHAELAFSRAGLTLDQDPSTFVLTVSCLCLSVPVTPDPYGIHAQLNPRFENKL